VLPRKLYHQLRLADAAKAMDDHYVAASGGGCSVDKELLKRLHLSISSDKLAHDGHASEAEGDLVLADTWHA
jgi:hypothetical protein